MAEGNQFESAPSKNDRPMTSAQLRVGVAPGDDEPYEGRGPFSGTRIAPSVKQESSAYYFHKLTAFVRGWLAGGIER